MAVNEVSAAASADGTYLDDIQPTAASSLPDTEALPLMIKLLLDAIPWPGAKTG